MSRRPGQALRAAPPIRDMHWAWRWAHALRRVAALRWPCSCCCAGLGGLAWRLAEAPLDLPHLARRIEATVNARPANAGQEGPRLEIGQAAIAWEGFRGGTAAPLDIRLREVRLRRRRQAEIDLPEAAAHPVLPRPAARHRGAGDHRAAAAPAARRADRGRHRARPRRAGAARRRPRHRPRPTSPPCSPDLMLPASDRDALSRCAASGSTAARRCWPTRRRPDLDAGGAADRHPPRPPPAGWPAEGEAHAADRRGQRAGAAVRGGEGHADAPFARHAAAGAAADRTGRPSGRRSRRSRCWTRR